jgi:hypothetical protein
MNKVRKGDILEVRGKIARKDKIAMYQREPQLKFLKVLSMHRFEYFSGMQGPFVMALIQFSFLDNLAAIIEIETLRTKDRRRKKHVSI